MTHYHIIKNGINDESATEVLNILNQTNKDVVIGLNSDGNTLNIEDNNLILKSRAQLANENQAKCNKKAAGEKAWANRCGLSAVDRVLMCVGA